MKLLCFAFPFSSGFAEAHQMLPCRSGSASLRHPMLGCFEGSFPWGQLILLSHPWVYCFLPTHPNSPTISSPRCHLSLSKIPTGHGSQTRLLFSMTGFLIPIVCCGPRNLIWVEFCFSLCCSGRLFGRTKDNLQLTRCL